MNEKLLELLKDARVSKRLTQRTVAEKLGVKDNTISNWEKGKTEPDIETYIQLCRLYEVDYCGLLEMAYRPMNIKIKSEENLAPFEQEHIKKYRTLDERGRKAVDDTLDREYEFVKPKFDYTKWQDRHFSKDMSVREFSINAMNAISKDSILAKK
ncbi:MAG: pezA [Firmicutes bacterium]|nr:pezA [Bacillota bacterium]